MFLNNLWLDTLGSGGKSWLMGSFEMHDSSYFAGVSENTNFINTWGLGLCWKTSNFLAAINK